MANPQLNVLDAALIQSVALPATATSVTTAVLDVGPKTAHGSFVRTTMELELVYPTLNTTQLPNAATVVYDLLQSANADGSSPATLELAVVAQTGSASSGAAGGSFRYAIPSGVLTQRYVLAKATTGNTPGSCVAASMTLQARF